MSIVIRWIWASFSSALSSRCWAKGSKSVRSNASLCQISALSLLYSPARKCTWHWVIFALRFPFRQQACRETQLWRWGQLRSYFHSFSSVLNCQAAAVGTRPGTEVLRMRIKGTRTPIARQKSTQGNGWQPYLFEKGKVLARRNTLKLLLWVFALELFRCLFEGFLLLFLFLDGHSSCCALLASCAVSKRPLQEFGI